MKLFFSGDFLAKNPENIEMSEELKQLLQECDINCLNFEGPLPIGKPITIKGTAVLPQSVDSPAWCEANGFNLISLANNHMGDFGEKALKSTIDAFKTSLLVGAGNWDEAYQIRVIEINKLKCGFLSVAQCEFGILNDNWGNKNSLGCAWINHQSINGIIQKAKEKLDFVIVLTHAGIEYTDIPLPEWRDRYKELIDSGADAVIGGHPHVPQGWEVYNNKPIFYSLGNFYFDSESKQPYWNNGLSVMLTLDEEKHISYRVINTIKNKNKISIDTSDQIKQHNERLYQMIQDDKIYIEEVDKICLNLWKSYEGVLLRSLNSDKADFSIKSIGKYFYHLSQRRKPEYRYLLNYFRCESHRFVISRAVKLLTGVKI